MIAARTISCPLPAGGDRRNWASLFERWLGYPLHPHARRVIAHLERQRARRQPQRLYVSDPNAASGILRKALVQYVRWLAICIRPQAPFCVVGRSRSQLSSLGLPHRPWRIANPDRHITATGRNPDYIRGLNFPMALILDSDAYPRRGRHLRRVLAAVNPCIGYGSNTLLVVHGTARPTMRVNTFTNELRRTENPYPKIDPSDGEPDPPPETEPRTVLLHIPPDTGCSATPPLPPPAPTSEALLP